jgi:hypothetical protein
MKISRQIALYLGFAVASADLAAQSTGRVKFQTTRPNPAVTAYGYYVGPFYGTLLSDPTRPQIDLFCVDVLNRVAWGQEWDVNFTGLGSNDYSKTRHGIDDRPDYVKAAWLADQFQSTSTSQWGGLQAAIWNLLNPGSPNGGTAERQWLDAVNTWFASPTNVRNFDMSRWTVVTATGAAGLPVGGGPQEFLTTATFATPEPETWVLMGTGLLCLLGIAVKRGRIV